MMNRMRAQRMWRLCMRKLSALLFDLRRRWIISLEQGWERTRTPITNHFWTRTAQVNLARNDATEVFPESPSRVIMTFMPFLFTFLRIHLNARYLAVPSKRICGDVALLTHFLATFKINHHFDFSKLRGTGRRGVSIELCKWLTTRRCIGPNERNEAAR